MSLLHIGGQVGGTKLEAIILIVLTLGVIWLHVTLLDLFRSRSESRKPNGPSQRLRRHERLSLEEDGDGGVETGTETL